MCGIGMDLGRIVIVSYVGRGICMGTGMGMGMGMGTGTGCDTKLS
jgi:hypothetical protein